ncbi:hypothetical protein F5X99DRAFT_664 [Biscogniauxia marginata]|nr:hypothetical protein F5X99DRAFT_664 [Biscogniauxia marginata]
MMRLLHYCCKLKVCRNRRVKGSEYCESHICKEWYRNRNCYRRGKGSHGLCPDHANCVKQHGGRRCGRPRKKLDTDYKYCLEIHGCQEDDCKASNLGSRSANVITRWCINHACGNTECAEPRVGGGQGCKDHTCHAEGCVLMVPGTRDADKSKVENYCPGHRTCNKDRCANPIFVHNSNRNSRFCFEHFCKPGAGTCEKERVDAAGAGVAAADAEACEEHTCVRYHLNRACFKPRAATAGSLYCADHECSRPGCQKERFAAKEWCSEHLCSSPLELREDCSNEREGGTAAAAADQIYCGDHKTCAEPGCREFRAFRGNGVARGDKCEEHSKPRCKFPNCASAPDGGGEGRTDFCAAHLCQYGQGCRQAPIPGTPICWLHKCAEPTCLRPRIPSSPSPYPYPYPSHAFPPSSSSSSSSSPSDMTATMTMMMMTMMMLQGGRLGSYCHEHTCRARDCVRKIFVPSSFSSSSSFPPAPLLSAPDGTTTTTTTGRPVPEYCDEHKCRERDCLAAGERDNSGYCREHDGSSGGGGGGWGTTVGAGAGGGWGSGRTGSRKNYYRAIRW